MTVCQNCGQHQGTVKWTAGALDMAHGFYQMWCEGCALRKQIEHAEERAAALPELRQRLADFEAERKRTA